MRGNITSDKNAYNNFISYKMIIKLNIFKTNMKHKVNGQVKRLTLLKNNCGGLEMDTNISQQISNSS